MESVGALEPMVQILAQLGALGLLGIIVWHLPRIVKELTEWREASESAHRLEREHLKAERTKIHEDHRNEREMLLKAYREESRYEREVCERNFGKLAEMGTMHQQTTHQCLDKLGQSLDRVGDTLDQHDRLARAAIDKIEKIATDPRAQPSNPPKT